MTTAASHVLEIVNVAAVHMGQAAGPAEGKSWVVAANLVRLGMRGSVEGVHVLPVAVVVAENVVGRGIVVTWRVDVLVADAA